MAKKTLLDNIIESIKGIDGRLIKQSGTTKQMISDLNYKVVAPAKSAADNAVKTADAAVASAKVTSASVSAIASATAEAKAGVNDAMSSIQQAIANASSDAAKIRSDVAKVQDEINTAKTANESEIKSIQDDLKKTSASIDTVKGHLESVSSDLDTYAKSAADQGHDITVIKQKQGQFEVDYAGTKGDVNQIRADIKGLSESLKDSGGNIASLQATAEKLQASMSDTQKNVSDLQVTAKKYERTFEDHSGRLSKVEQTASTLTNEFSDEQGHLNRVEQTANGTKQTVANLQGDVNNIQVTAKGLDTRLTTQGNDIATIKANASNFSTRLSGVEKSGSELANRFNSLQVGGRNLAKNTGDPFIMGCGIPDTIWKDNSSYLELPTTTVHNEILPQGDNQFYLSLEKGETYTQTIWVETDANVKDLNVLQFTWFTYNVGHDSQPARVNKIGDKLYKLYSTYTWPGKNNNNVRLFDFFSLNKAFDLTGSGSYLKFLHPKIERGNQSTDWTPNPDDITDKVTANSTQIDQNKQAIVLKANQDTVNNLTGEVNDAKAQLKVQAGQISSKVSSEAFKMLDNKVGGAIAQIDKNATAIDQTNKDISLKADQTEVDKVKSTASQNSSQIQLMANEIKSKVTSTDVDNIVNSKGYTTTSTVQSLVTQKADDWNLNLTKLKTDVNAIKMTGGGVNLLTNTDKDISVTSYTTYDYPAWANIDTGFSFEHGKTYTFSAEANNSNNNITEASIRVFEYSTNTQVGIYAFPADGNRHSVTFTIPNDSHNYHLSLYAGHAGIVPGVDVTTTYHHPNLEFGTVAHDWSPAPSDMATVTSVTNLSATVDGIKSTVANKADQSTVTQLSNVIQSKVSSSDFDNLSKAVELQTLDSADINNMRTNGHYFVHNLANNPIGGWVYVDVTGNGNDRIRQDVYQDIGNQHCYRRWNSSWWTDWEEGATKSEINQLSNDINLRVTKGDLISQINLQAGTSLIQSDKLVLDAKTTVFTGDAFIPSAAISNISADKITLGSSTMYDSNGTLNLVNVKDGITSKIISTRGIVNNDGVFGNASIIDFFSDSHTKSFEVNPSGVTVTPTLFFERYNQNPEHWLGFSRHKVRQEGLLFHTWDDEGERFFVGCHARFDRNISATGNIYQGSWDGTAGKPEAGILSIKGGNTIWSGSDYLAIGDNVSNSYTKVIAKSFSQQSTLSAKTNIETVDPKDALDLVNRTDIRSYQYKTDVAEGKTKRYTSLIIDDVNDVSEYYAPDEFTNEERTGRDDGSAVGYLFLAVKELTRRIKILEEKLNG